MAKEPQASKNDAPKNILDTSIIENFNQTDEESMPQALPKEKKRESCNSTLIKFA